MIGWNVFIEPKFIEQPLLQLPLLPHHPLGPPTVDDLLILTDQGGSRGEFFNGIQDFCTTREEEPPVTCCQEKQQE